MSFSHSYIQQLKHPNYLQKSIHSWAQCEGFVGQKWSLGQRFKTVDVIPKHTSILHCVYGVSGRFNSTQTVRLCFGKKKVHFLVPVLCFISVVFLSWCHCFTLNKLDFSCWREWSGWQAEACSSLVWAAKLWPITSTGLHCRSGGAMLMIGRLK